jgi:hypothetical protein
MVMQQLTRSILVGGLAGALALGELAAQEFHFTGGAVKGTQVRTNMGTAEYSMDDPVTIGGTRYLELASSNLTVHLDAGESDLFVYEIDAECSLVSAGQGDSVSFQARLNGFVRAIIGGGPALLQPQDVPTDLEICAASTRQSVAKSWAVRLSGGSAGADFTFTIWWRAVDVNAFNALIVRLDNRTVRLTRYN